MSVTNPNLQERERNNTTTLSRTARCSKISIFPLSHFLDRFFLVLVLAFLIGSGILVLLVLRDEIIHVALCLSELHLVHALTCVPVQEGLPPEHGRELLAHPPKHLLNGS
ncbi:hypothetical protein ACMD2_07758 [Ananas comosus]|uniref:Uncharacterized protein n=1 Tax=Ananas comosus TaxID=4615 RepID=A0A199V9T8_ANACO|nr:hypothetical protein ACMD2_07758 [Ananas comosus]